MIKVVHCKKEPYDVLIDRTTIWGNPFKIGVHGSRAEVIERYRKWLLTMPHLLAKIDELDGKTLGCWCKPEACHGDVIAQIIEERKNERISQEKITQVGCVLGDSSI